MGNCSETEASNSGPIQIEGTLRTIEVLIRSAKVEKVLKGLR